MSSEFSKRVEDLRKAQQDVSQVPKAKKDYPTGFEPGVKWDEKSKKGTATTEGLPKKITSWDFLLEEWGFNPEEFEVDGDTVQYRAWDTNMGQGNTQRMHYYKVDIIKKGASNIYDPAPLIEAIKKYKAPKKTVEKGDNAFLVALSDWQLGKEDGDGIEGVTERVLRGIDDVVTRIKFLRKGGMKIGKLVISSLGDIIEGCNGFYEMQTFSVQINQRDQINIGSNLMMECIKKWAPLFDEVLVVAVGGNHGENRNGSGKAYTNFGDNFDLLLADQVARICAANKKAFGHVKFYIPDEDLDVTLDVNGTTIAFAHGHQFRRGAGGASQKAFAWWKNQSVADLPAGGADVLLSAHFHHFSMLQEYGKTHIQAPALDGGSLWVQNTLGLTTNPGILTFCVNKNGVHNLEIL